MPWCSLDPFVGILGKVGEAFDKLPGPIKQTIVLIGAIAAAVGPTVMSIGGFISAMVQMSAIFGGAIGGVGLLSGAFSVLLPVIVALVIPIGILIGTIALLAAGFAIAWQTSSTLRDVTTRLADAFKVLAGHLSTALGLFTSGNWKGGIEEIKKAFTDLPAFLHMIDWQKTGETIVNEIRDGIQSHKSEILNTLNTIADDITTFLKSVNWESVGTTLGKTIGGFIAMALRAAIAGLSGTDLGIAGPSAAAYGKAGLPGGAGKAPAGINQAAWEASAASAAASWGTGGGGVAGLESAGKDAAGAFIKGFEDGLSGTDLANAIIAAIKVAVPIVIDVLIKVTIEWPLQAALGDMKLSDFLTFKPKTFLHVLAFTILIPLLTPFLILYEALKWIIEHFSVHLIAFNITGLSWGAGLVQAVYDALRWLWDKVLHAIAFTLSGLIWGATTFAQDVYNALRWLWGVVSHALSIALSGLIWGATTFAQDVYNALVWLWGVVSHAISISISVLGDIPILHDVYNILQWILSHFSTYTITLDVMVHGYEALKSLYDRTVGLLAQLAAAAAAAAKPITDIINPGSYPSGPEQPDYVTPSPSPDLNPDSYPVYGYGCNAGYYFVQCSTCPPGYGTCYRSAEEGGIFSATLGGQLIRIGEGGEDEAVVPLKGGKIPVELRYPMPRMPTLPDLEGDLGLQVQQRILIRMMTNRLTSPSKEFKLTK